MQQQVALIIPAAGTGSRFSPQGGQKKPYVQLAGKPILFHTLARFSALPDIIQRVLVVHPDDVEQVRDIYSSELKQAGVTDVIGGGDTRQQSVAKGLGILRDDITIVAVHDSVRPFVSRRAIAQSIAMAAEVGGAVVSCKMVATVKRACADGIICETVPRHDLWMAQTPQTFRRDLFVRAHQQAVLDGVDGTDDAFLLERLGQAVAIVHEGPDNIKITTPEDLAIAEAMLAGGFLNLD